MKLLFTLLLLITTIALAQQTITGVSTAAKQDTGNGYLLELRNKVVSGTVATTVSGSITVGNSIGIASGSVSVLNSLGIASGSVSVLNSLGIASGSVSVANSIGIASGTLTSITNQIGVSLTGVVATASTSSTTSAGTTLWTLSANAARKSLEAVNTTNTTCYIKKGASATSSSGIVIYSGGYYNDLQPIYTGAVTAICSGTITAGGFTFIEE